MEVHVQQRFVAAVGGVRDRQGLHGSLQHSATCPNPPTSYRRQQTQPEAQYGLTADTPETTAHTQPAAACGLGYGGRTQHRSQQSGRAPVAEQCMCSPHSSAQRSLAPSAPGDRIEAPLMRLRRRGDGPSCPCCCDHLASSASTDASMSIRMPHRKPSRGKGSSAAPPAPLLGGK